MVDVDLYRYSVVSLTWVARLVSAHSPNVTPPFSIRGGSEDEKTDALGIFVSSAQHN